MHSQETTVSVATAVAIVLVIVWVIITAGIIASVVEEWNKDEDEIRVKKLINVVIWPYEAAKGFLHFLLSIPAFFRWVAHKGLPAYKASHKRGE